MKYGRIIVEGKDIPKDEPLFLVRGKDKLALRIIQAYAQLAEESGTSEKLVEEIWALYWLVKEWQRDNAERIKLPD